MWRLFHPNNGAYIMPVESIVIVFAYGSELPNDGIIDQWVVADKVIIPTQLLNGFDPSQDDDDITDIIYAAQGNNPSGSKIDKRFYSLSKGDVILLNAQAWYCSSFGWKKLTAQQTQEWNDASESERSWIFAEVESYAV